MELTDQNFEKEIGENQKPVLVDFWAVWCPPCKILAPMIEVIARDYQDELEFAKVNIDTAPEIAAKHGIDRVPAIVLFKEGKPVSGFVGLRPESQIKEWLDKALKEEKDGQG